MAVLHAISRSTADSVPIQQGGFLFLLPGLPSDARGGQSGRQLRGLAARRHIEVRAAADVGTPPGAYPWPSRSS